MSIWNFFKTLIGVKKIEDDIVTEVKAIESLLSKAGRKYGYLPDLPDHRDLKAINPIDPATHPASVDLSESPFMPPVWDQGQLGSCVAHSTGAAYFFCRAMNKLQTWNPSRLMIYFNARDMEGSAASDNGCMIRDAIKTLNTLGVCNEERWPYDPTQFAVKPPQICYDKGQYVEVTQYARVDQTVEGIEGALAEGFPVTVGVTLYDSFESDAVAASGIVPMPDPKESCLGGHAVLIVGYDHATQMFKVRNSWNTTWGIKGYFLIPYAYILNSNLADDLWILQIAK